MIQYNKEYFSSPYYFFIAEKSNKISLYYSVGETIMESKEVEDKIDFNKKHGDKVKRGVSSILKNKKLKTKKEIKRFFEPLTKEKDEIEELVDSDGTMLHSTIPILDMGLTPKKTTDQTVAMARDVQNPLTRGYRKYYGESTKKDIPLTEVDYSEAFGFEETKDMDGKDTYEYLIKQMGMNPDEAKERTEQFGKDPYGKRKQRAPKKIREKPNFIDRMTLSERERKEMIKVVEDIILNKKSKDADINKKEEKSSKLIRKNINTLKKMAEKEGISINQLIKMLKSE